MFSFTALHSPSYLWLLCILRLVLARILPSSGDICYAKDMRSIIVNDVLYFMAGDYTFFDGDTNSAEQELYYMNLTSSFPVEGYITANSFHSISIPDAFPFSNQGAFFTFENIIYSYSDADSSDNITNTLTAYNILKNTWSQKSISGGNLNIGGRSADFRATVSGTGMGFYLGAGDSHIEGMVVFNGSNAENVSWKNQTSGTPQIDSGAMQYVRSGKAGVLLAIGGLDTSAKSSEFADGCCFATTDMGTISVYDIDSETWYTVSASGDVPEGRQDFCSVVSASPDDSSFQVTIHGGWNLFDETAFDDVYVLAVPSFMWIKIDDESNTEASLPGETGRFGGECQIYNERSMIVLGGDLRLGNTQANGLSCNASYPAIRLLDTSTYTWQTQFQPDLADYTVPKSVSNVIGGNSSGGATIKSPSGGFANVALESIFSQTVPRPTSTNSAIITATSSLSPITSVPASQISTSPTSTETTTPSQKKSTSAGAIAGGIIGGLAVVVTILISGVWCLRRQPNKTEINGYQRPELDGNGMQQHSAVPELHEDEMRTEMYVPPSELPDHGALGSELP